MRSTIITLWALALLGTASAVEEAPVKKTISQPVVKFEQNLNAQVPLDLTFRNDEGAVVKLGDYFGDKPVVLSLVYYECPMLCTLVLNGLTECMNELPFDAGQEFTSLTISFDHEETHVLAAKKKAGYLEQYKRPGAADGWDFLVGDEAAIKKLTETVGFGFEFVPDTGEYAHKSGIIVLTPGGVVSRYFPGIEYDARDVRLGLVDASASKIGSVVDRLFLLCYHYDPAIGKYGLLINRVVNTACMITLICLLAGLWILFKREKTIPVPVS